MKQQATIQTPKQTLSPQTRGLLPHAAVRAPSDHDLFATSPAGSRFTHDFSQVAVRPSVPMVRQSCSNNVSGLPRIQTKLKIGKPGDKYEQEADQVAEQVMRMPEPRVSSSAGGSSLANGVNPGSGTIQRVCTPCSAEYKAAENESRSVEPANLCPKCRVRENGFIQAKTVGDVAPEVTPEISAGIQSLQGSGRPLSGTERSFFEPRFGADFSGVRVHTDARAAGEARSINARAFTLGRNVVFGAGQYSPDTDTGRHLIAHELTHTIQQKSGDANSRNVIMRRWDQATSDCADVVTDKWLRRVVVEQETPQSVTLHWSDGSIESGQCSSGKGHCCVDAATPEGVACSVTGSRVNGSNCTPITERNGYAVRHRDLDHNRIRFWTEFVPTRGIALHTYSPVDGTPLSHGCVRLNEATAKKIFCGARQNQTNVQVQGFARPMCSWPALRAEWVRDFDEGGLDMSTFDGDHDRQRAIRETRRMLNESFGHELQVSEIRALTANDVPICGGTAERPTLEEQSLTANIVQQPRQSQTPLVVPVSPPAQGTVPARILAQSNFNRFLVPFTSQLRGAGNLASARRVVRRRGRELWRAATRRAQASTNPDTDDRPLFWARLQMSRALQQWSPRFSLSNVNRADLIARFERASRGMDTVRFRQTGVKRILISGFDPFGLRAFQNRTGSADIRRSNPSGAAVLALDGQTISVGGIRAEVQGVNFPVRFADFDTGIVENLFQPFISGTNPVDMIMTISQGGSAFEVERYAGRRRSSGSFPGNLGQVGGGTRTNPVEPPGIGTGPEFLRTTLPEQPIRSALGRPTPLSGETEVDEIPAGGGQPANRPSGGPTVGSTAVEGSGGGFLSNEIFYRTALLRTQAGSSLPLGHLHVPTLNLPTGDALNSPQFQAERQAIIDRVRLILKAALSTL